MAEFKRTKKEFLDVVAKICSLFLTMHSIFSILLAYYSQSYVNYQIVQKILSQKNEKEEKYQLKSIDLGSKIKNEINSIETPLINDFSEKNNSEGKIDLITDEEEKIDSIQDNINLPEFSFFDFYFNNYIVKFVKKVKSKKL